MTTRSRLVLAFVMGLPLACGDGTGGRAPLNVGGGVEGGTGGAGAEGGAAGDGSGGGGATGVGGGAGGESTGTGTGGAPAPRTCTLDSSSHCSCVDGTPSDTDPECTGTSIAGGTDQVGVCCQGTSSCVCDAYVCRYDADRDVCSCGLADTIDADVNGATVTTCPAPNEQRICCYQPDTDECTCSADACPHGWFWASSCSIREVAICGDNAGYKVSACSVNTR